MEKSEKFRLIYSIFLGVFTAAVGIAVICVAADIYYSGEQTGIYYTGEIVGERLLALAIPLILLIGAIIFGAIFPLYQVKGSRRPEYTLKRLKSKIPQAREAESDEFSAAVVAYKRSAIVRLVAWLVAAAVALAGAIVTLCYLVDTARFAGKDINAGVLAFVGHILPWLISAFAAMVASTVVCGVFASKQVSAAKTMIKTGDRTGEKGAPELAVETKAKAVLAKPAFSWIRRSVAAIKRAWETPAFVWAVRGVMFVVAVVFIVLGIINGGAADVLIKAINICKECIGMG